MQELKTITGEEFTSRVFHMIGKEWMLITAQKEQKVNTMTASWGGLGVLWGKNVAYVFIRESRYTKEFIDSSKTFSLSFFGENYKEDLKYLGTVSGRKEDKIEKSKLTITYKEEVPYFAEASTVLLCRKMAIQPITKDAFLDESIDTAWYKDHDYHTMYIAEIKEILIS